MLFKKKKTVPISHLKKLKQWYGEELKKRDDLIDELKEKNRLLMSSALKESDKRQELSEHAKKLLNIHKGLEKKVKKRK